MKTWITLFRQWMQSDYTRHGLVIRLAVDLFLVNLGFFLGILATVGFWAIPWPDTFMALLRDMLVNVWLANAPMLTACCLFAFILNGLYRGTAFRTMTYTGRVLGTVRAVGTAFLLFIVWVFMTKTYMPRSTLMAGWFFIFIFMVASRLLATALFRQYRLVPAGTHDIPADSTALGAAVISSQDGWIPPERLPERTSWPHFEDDEISAAVAVLQSGRINQWTGSEVASFQEEFAAFCGVRHAVALANGSVALELALKACGIGPGDEVIVTPRTFIASASSVVLQGAIPIFADVDRDSQNITADSIRAVLSPRTRAVIAVHLAGWPCDMDGIMACAREHDLVVIEDCAQAHGARYRNRPVGSFGHAAAFSFCQDKIMTTGGEGGMLVTNDSDVWRRAWSFKDHGKSYDTVYRREHPPGFRWLHESFGTNWRMTEMQAAIGRRQLRKLDDWVRSRRSNAEVLAQRFSAMKALRVVQTPADLFHSYYKYYVFVRPEQLKTGWNRDRIMNEVTSRGVPCFSGSCGEIYREKAFVVEGLQPPERLPVAQELGETSLMFLVHPTLTAEDMQKTADEVESVLAAACL
jgi:dTDP-4-amino-4,6-dideoxygalactose transaminase